MLHVVLYQPEIPPNTGNIIRLCANTGAQLHLVHPLGFRLDEKSLKRAGLDYHEWTSLREYDSMDAFIATHQDKRLFACETGGERCYSDVQYQKDDMFLFGPETRGLPANILAHFDASQWLYLPMQTPERSLNLSNAVAVLVYEAWRQLGFAGGKGAPRQAT